MDCEKSYTELRDLLEVQGSHGNWNYSPYMNGLYNGLELALCTIERRNPVFRDCPEDGYLYERPEPTDLPEPVATEIGHG